MKKEIFLLVFLLGSLLSYAQVQLISDKIQGNDYFLKLEIPDNYRIITKDGRTLIDFQQQFDESKPGYFSIASFDIFIALPTNNKANLTSNIIRQSKIDALPPINPVVKVGVSGELEYEKSPDIFKETLPLTKLNGYLWIENQYCAHVTINPYIIEYERRTTNKVNEIELTFNFENNLSQQDVSSSHNSDSPIINFGSFKSDKKPNWIINDSDSWIDYNLTYIKIGTVKNDIYRVDDSDLLSLGINPGSINPRTFRMFKHGIEVPIYVKGETDNSFDPEDYIEFVGERNMGGRHRVLNNYGEPYTEYLDRYSDTTIYWLTWGSIYGQRVAIGSNGNAQPNIDTLVYYNELIHYEKNNWFDFSMADQVRREMPYWYENKTWVDGQLGVGTRNYTFSVSNVFAGGNLKVFSRLQDYASNITQNAHLLAISVNSAAKQDSGYINKYQQKILSGVYPGTILNNGNNTLRIHSFATSATLNACAFDWYEIEYPRYLKTYSDTLLFSFPFINGQQDLKGIKITNVLNTNPILWKYGENYKKYSLSTTNNEIILFDSLSKWNKFILTKSDKIKKPFIYYAKQFTNLRNPQNQADYIAITHKKFITKTEEYVAFIANKYNVTAKVIDVDDIYDEFSYGFFNPEVIKDFLQATHNHWQEPLPKYVCLIGGATYDYHGNKTIFQSLPPKYNYVPSFGASVSDNWFVTWDTTGAYIPQMNIGRIPVKSVEELDYYMNKHVSYVSKPFDDWNKRYMFFSGGNFTDPAQLAQLKAVNDFVINNYVVPAPIGGNFKHFYKTVNPNTNFGPYSPAEIQQTINDGSVVISYLGHSGTQTWDNSITQPSQLKNNVRRNPLITDFGCSTARFGEPDITSFSQLFLLDPEGQAIAYIGNSSLGFLSTSIVAPKLFYKKVFQDSVYTISKALKEAKLELLQNYGSSGVYKLFALTNTLIGDPITKLPIPGSPNLSLKASDILLLPENPSDNLDSISLKINYYNFGKVLNDSFKVLIKDTFNDSTTFQVLVAKVLPKYTDSIKVNVPVKSMPGAHNLTVTLDVDNQVDELSENDNQVNLEFIVSSSAIRNTIPNIVENQLGDSIIFINPVSPPSSDSLIVQISEDENFTNVINKSSKFGIFYSPIKLNDLQSNKRFWLRSKIVGSQSYGAIQTFYKGSGLSYLLRDSLSFRTSELMNLKEQNNSIVFDTSLTVLSASSAGFFDGMTANILLNSQNFIPSGNVRGHHICLFDDSTYHFDGYYFFDILGGGTSTVNDYINFLDTLSIHCFVAIAVCDEGSTSSVALKNQIKSLGSIYIDSLVFRGSWGIIGKKGAVPGSVPEGFTRPYGGRVVIDTTIYQRYNSGTLTTSTIGPVGYWDSLKVQQNLKTQTTIKYKPIVIKPDGVADTLNYLNLSNNMADLSFINAKTYPRMKLLAEFNSEDDSISPSLSSLAVEYKTAPELGLNYQTVQASQDTLYIKDMTKDTIFNGDTLGLVFAVMNAGETRADSCNVIVQLIKPNNAIDTLKNSTISIDPFSGKKFETRYISGTYHGNGDFAFNILVDPGNKITELFKDNNIFRVPFFVRADTITSITKTLLEVKVDGKEIFDGDFVSPNPQMEISLHYPSWFPVSDTSAIRLSLNGKQLYANQFGEIKRDTIKREIAISYNTFLKDGEYLFRIYAQNVNGIIETSPAYEVVFNVMNEANIIDVYNYPNPFKSNTHFTFRLTQKPDELKIKIFTVAGRLIRELVAANLSTDFNKIEWDGRDQDGDFVANGVYLYKVIMKKNDETKEVTQKLSVIR